MARLLVALPELNLLTRSDAEGGYRFAPIPPGTYDLLFDPEDQKLLEKGIVVVPGQTANLDADLERRQLLLPPALGSTAFDELGAEELYRWGQDGQLGRAAAAIGIPLAQGSAAAQFVTPYGLRRAGSGRGSLQIDGRDLVDPFSGYADWSLVAQPTENLASLEATSSAVELRSRQPRYSEGGFIRVGAGERGATQTAVGWRGYLVANWWVSVAATGRSEGDRLDQSSVDGSLRIDKVWSNGARLELESGWSRLRDALQWTPAGAVETLESERPWSRGRYVNDRWEIDVVYDRHETPRQRLAVSGSMLSQISQRRRFEIRRRGRSAGDRWRWDLGAAYRGEQFRSSQQVASAAWIRTPIQSDHGKLSGRLEWQPTERLTLSGALGWNGSNRYSTRWTPVLNATWQAAERHQLQFGYEEDFRAATIAEQSLRVADGGQIDLTALESICGMESIDCGFGSAPTSSFIVGNRGLDLETIRRWTVQWRTRIRPDLELQLRLQHAEHSDVVGDAVEQCGGPLGDCTTPTARANAQFQSYAAPSALSAMAQADLLLALQTALGPQFAALSNDRDGSPLWVASTFATLGDVRADSAELRGDWGFAPDWRLRGSVGWFDADLRTASAAVDDYLLPNQPEFRGSVTLRHVAKRWDGQLAARWSAGYRAGAPFVIAEVDSFVSVDAQLNWSWSPKWTLSMSAIDLTDDEHLEWAGAEQLGRRLMLSGRLTF